MQYPALIQANPIAATRSDVSRVLANNVLDLPFGSHSHVAVASGKVAAFLAFAGYDRKNDVATYALRVLNDSAYEVLAQLTCVLKDGTTRSASPLTFKVPPFSMRDDYVPVRLDITGRFERAIVEVRSDETYFSVDAPAPAFPAPKWMKWCWLPLVPVLLAATGGFMVPRVAPLSAPERVFAGTSMAIPYEASGYGNVEYSLSNRNRVQLFAGIAASSSGVLHFALPAQADGSPYTVHVRMRSPFGSAEQAATIAAVAPAQRPHAKSSADPRAIIDELRVEPSAVRAGQSLTVWYSTHASSGDVSLVDSSGTTWLRAPISPQGKSTLSVPGAAAGKTMRVVLHAQRGNQQAQSSVETIVLASDAVTTPQPQPPAPSEASAPAAPPQAGASMSLSSTVVSGGDNVTVRVSGMRGDVRIILEDRSGNTIAQGDGSQGATSIFAPVVHTVTRYFVVATFTDGVGQQSVLKTLTVTPR